jgi:hypothetical protein
LPPRLEPTPGALDLRFGLIEAGASWVPFLVHKLNRTLGPEAQTWGPKLLRDYRLYVACKADEDLPYLVGQIGEDNVLFGSDLRPRRSRR